MSDSTTGKVKKIYLFEGQSKVKSDVHSAQWQVQDGVVFLLLPCVLLAGVVFTGGRGMADLGLLANLSLVGPFLTGAGTFITLTFLSQSGG